MSFECHALTGLGLIVPRLYHYSIGGARLKYGTRNYRGRGIIVLFFICEANGKIVLCQMKKITFLLVFLQIKQ